MKILTCEMCESTDFVKQDGFFVCQQCGVKYTVEEARKMMTNIKEDAPVVKTPAEPQKVVEQPAYSEQTSNLLTVARRAHEQGNSAQAEEYYGKLVAQMPDSWEVAFFSVYYQSYNTINAHLGSAAKLIENCLPATLKLINNLENFDEKKEALKTVVQHAIRIGDLLAEASSRFYWDIGESIRYQYTQEYQSRLNNCFSIKITLGNLIEKHFNHPAFMIYAADAWHSAIKMLDDYSNFISRDPENVLNYALKIFPHRPKLVNRYLIDFRMELQREVDCVSQEETKTTRPVMLFGGLLLLVVAVMYFFGVKEIMFENGFMDTLIFLGIGVVLLLCAVLCFKWYRKSDETVMDEDKLKAQQYKRCTACIKRIDDVLASIK